MRGRGRGGRGGGGTRLHPPDPAPTPLPPPPSQVEVKLTGDGPWALPGAPEVSIHRQTGHTEASTVLHHAPSGTLFTGDVLSFGPDEVWAATGRLHVHRAFTWFSMPEQLKSLGALPSTVRPLLHILPGHGRPGSFAGHKEAAAALAELLTREGDPASAAAALAGGAE